MSGHYRKEKNCLNCGHHVEEHYCSHCGQPNLELKEPFWHFIGHSIGHYFHFDSKFFQTLVPLLTKPGQLTLDYLAGKRARYIHPVSLYIFVSVVYFIIVPHTLKEEKDDSKPKTEQGEKAAKAIRANRDKLDKAIPGTGRKIDIVLDSAVKFNKLSLPAKRLYLDKVRKQQAAKPNDSLTVVIQEFEELYAEANDTSYAAYAARQKILPKAERDNWLTQKAIKLALENGEKKPDKLTAEETKIDIKEEFKKYEPKQYFLLMPLLALFIMVNFRKNRIYYIDHLVFTIHGMTAYFIISIVTKPINRYIFGLDSWMSSIVNTLVFVGIVWYLYSGLKLFYQRSRNVTIRKTITVMFMYALAVSITKWMVTYFILHVMH